MTDVIVIDKLTKSFKGKTVLEDVNMRLQEGRIYGIVGDNGSGKIGKEQIESAMKTVGLDPSSKLRVGKYSLGMKQRLGIAQAIMEDQQLLILDEPMNALDKDAVEEMRKLFLSFKASGKTMLIVSHNEGDISTLCDEVYEFDGARIKRRENV